MSRRKLASTCGLALVLIGAACGKNNSSSTAPTNPTPPATMTPTITSVSPANPSASTSPQTLMVAGTNFQTGLTVTLTLPNGTTLSFAGQAIQSLTPTSFQITVTLAAAATYSLAVANPSGDRSSPFPIAVQPAAPQIQTWNSEGVRLTDASAGFPGWVLADVAAIQLRDGRWRLLMEAGGAIRSAISPDGISLTMETGVRIDPGPLGPLAPVSLVKVNRLDDGRIRAYFSSPPNMYSAITSDEGLTFSIEPGIRMSGSTVGASALSGGSLIRTRTGQWRMYFSNMGGAIGGKRVFSATSNDMLNWNLDTGVRVGEGTAISGSAEHPCAVALQDGSVVLYYFRPAPGRGLYTAASTDGLTFTTETPLGISEGNDPEIVSIGGMFRMYYNWGDDRGGTIFSATRNSLTSFVPAPILSFPGRYESFRPLARGEGTLRGGGGDSTSRSGSVGRRQMR